MATRSQTPEQGLAIIKKAFSNLLPPVHMSWYNYIVQCKDGTLYTGVAKDVVKRIDAHNRGKGAKYTRGRGPVKLVYLSKPVYSGDAFIEEYRIKKLSRAEKLKLCKS